MLLSAMLNRHICVGHLVVIDPAGRAHRFGPGGEPEIVVRLHGRRTALRINGVTIVPVLEEVLFVEKRLVLKEELHIRRRVSSKTVEVPVTLRKERAVVERVPPVGDIVSDEERTDDL